MTSKSVYKIAKWQSTFEKSDSKRYKTLSWVSLPIGFDSNGYQSLVDEFEEEAAAIYGAWCALVSLAAQANWRGVLCTSQKKPYTMARIARLTYLPSEYFEKLIEWASSEDIAWLEVVSEPDLDRLVVGRQPGDCWATEHNETVHNVTKPDGTERNGTTDHPIAVRPLIVEENKSEIFPIASSLAQALSGTQRIKDDDREDAWKYAAIDWAYEPMNGICKILAEDIKKKRIRGKPPDRPWGYFKSRFIDTSKKVGLDFDSAWNAITIPEKPRCQK